MMTKRIGASGAFSMAAILTVDNSLNTPDFRAREKTFREITDVLDLVAPRGEVLIQTRLPQEPLFKYFRDNDYEAFAAEELSLRKALNFPPYSRLLNILVYGSPHVPEQIRKTIHDSFKNIEVLGPIEKKTKKGIMESSLLLKSQNRRALHAAARTVLEQYKNAKDVEIRIDVDPY
jgi:primosomal protein N' (replication factor Y)